MKLLLRILILLVVFLFQPTVYDALAQKKSKSMRAIERRSGGKERLLQRNESKKVRDAKERVEEQKENQARQSEQASEDSKKRHFDRQSEKTQERMKEAEQKSEELKKRNREPFLKRLFKRNKR